MLFLLGLFCIGSGLGVLTPAWASTRLSQDIELQAWFRARNTFQTDGKEHFDWVQWRNEAFIWLTYEDMVENRKLKLTGTPILFVNSAALSVRFRARVDPVYYLRDHYRRIYDENHRSDFFNPESGFRAAYIDLSHGEVGPGRLSTRIGYQQIVWGESDLFRSLDIINPLRIDQNFPIFTLAFSGQGYFHSKLEQRLAMAFEPRGQQWLLSGQWWWRNFLSLPMDVSLGTSWFPSSRMDNSWTLLNYFTNRNLLWVEGAYYLL